MLLDLNKKLILHRRDFLHRLVLNHFSQISMKSLKKKTVEHEETYAWIYA